MNFAQLLSMALCSISAAGAADILALLERDLQGKISPFLAGRHGSFYIGGQSLAQNSPLTSLWNVKENETLGFMHPFFRDGRARGIAITCDEVTGCGHSLHGWEFYRDTRVLNGSVTVNNKTYTNPYPTTLLWRPDRLTARYDIEPGVAIQEVKFFTNDDVLIDIITLLPGASSEVHLSFSGMSYVNTHPIPPASRDPSSKGLPPTTQRSVKRNATSELDARFASHGCGGHTRGHTRGHGHDHDHDQNQNHDHDRGHTHDHDYDHDHDHAHDAVRPSDAAQCSAVRVEEHGTAYAKPLDCKFAPFPPGVDCLLKEGPMMYEGQSVFIAASTDISSSLTLGRDADRRATYAFSATLSTHTPLVLGWVMGDDEAEARTRIAAHMTPTAALAGLAARTKAANDFLSTKVPQLNVTLKPKVSGVSGVDHNNINTPTWDEHKFSTCRNTNANKYHFIHNAATLGACEAACGKDPECKQVEYKHTSPNMWCAMYNVSGPPGKMIAGSDFDCVCKGPCPTTPGPSPGPGPGPHPHPPSPIPPMNRTLDFNNAYYFGWAMYWLMLLESNHPPYEVVGHAQSAANNFLGIHLHDSQYYLRMGSWVHPDLHPRYAHGNVLMWHLASKSPMYANKSSPYWQYRQSKGLMPDNMGATWIASSTCDQLSEMVQDAWVIYERSGGMHAPNNTYLALAYDLFSTVLKAEDGNITSPHQKQNFGSGKGLNALLSLSKMAGALGKQGEAAQWTQLLHTLAPHFSAQWGRCGDRLECNEGVNSFSSAMAPAPYFKDEWAQKQADAFLLNDVTGYYPPNSSFGAVLLAKPLNTTATKIGPWVAHTTYTYEAIEGLFRHNAHDAAIQLATGHIRDMQRSFGWTIFPEAWSLLGGPWGDQWYNWGSCVSTVMTLERLAGVSYTSLTRAPGATADGVFTVRDFLPEDWARVEVRVPMFADQWVSVLVERLGTHSKRITVSGNPLGALAIQPAIGSRHVTKVQPAGSTMEDSANRVDWLFVGAAAKGASVVVAWS